MYCRECGNPVKETDTVCGVCGAALYDDAHEKTGRQEALESDGQPEEKSPVHYEEFSWNIYDFPKPKKTEDLKMEWPKEPERPRRKIDLDEPISFDIDVFRKRNHINEGGEAAREQAPEECPWGGKEAEDGAPQRPESRALPTEDMWKGGGTEEVQAAGDAAESFGSRPGEPGGETASGGEGQSRQRLMAQAKASAALDSAEAAEEARRESLKKADPFFDFTQTNVVFQNMLDQEYEKLQNRKKGVPYVEGQWDFRASEAGGSRAEEKKEASEEKRSAKKPSPEKHSSEKAPNRNMQKGSKEAKALEMPLSPEDALEQMILSGTRAVDSEKEATIQVDLDAIKRAAERRYGYETVQPATEERLAEQRTSQESGELRGTTGTEAEQAPEAASADVQEAPTEEKQSEEKPAEKAKQQSFRKRRTMTEMEQAREEYFRMLDQEMNGLQVKVEVNASYGKPGKVVTDVDIKPKESGRWFRKRHKAPVYEEEAAESQTAESEPPAEATESQMDAAGLRAEEAKPQMDAVEHRTESTEPAKPASGEAAEENTGFRQAAAFDRPVSFFEGGALTVGSEADSQWDSDEAATFARWQRELGEDSAGALRNAEREADREAASKVEAVKTQLQSEPPAADWLLSGDGEKSAKAKRTADESGIRAQDKTGGEAQESKPDRVLQSGQMLRPDQETQSEPEPADDAEDVEDIKVQQTENTGAQWSYEADYDEEDEERDGGAGRVIIKIALGLIACVILLEASALGVVHIAPDSAAAQTVYRIQDKIAGLLFHNGESQDGQNEPDGSGDDVQGQQDGQIDGTDVQGSGAGQADAALQTPDPVPMADKTALIATQLDKNTNIGSITANPQLSYAAGTDYGVADINNSQPIENNIWYQNEDGSTVYYDREIVGTLIAFNSQWVDYVNGVSKDAVALTKEGSQAYTNATGFSKIGKVTEKFISMEIGDIRQGENGFYLWAAEKIELTENAATTTANYRWIYCLEPVGREMKIVNYIRIS